MKTKYECDCCGHLWDTEEACREHEDFVSVYRAEVHVVQAIKYEADVFVDFSDGTVGVRIDERPLPDLYQEAPGEPLHVYRNLTDEPCVCFRNPGKPCVDETWDDRIVVTYVKVLNQDDKSDNEIEELLVSTAKEQFKKIREGITEFIGDANE